MKICDALEQLLALQKKHGDTEVYFDCPKCGESFTPNRVVGVAVHLTQEKNDGAGGGMFKEKPK